MCYQQICANCSQEVVAPGSDVEMSADNVEQQARSRPPSPPGQFSRGGPPPDHPHTAMQTDPPASRSLSSHSPHPRPRPPPPPAPPAPAPVLPPPVPPHAIPPPAPAPPAAPAAAPAARPSVPAPALPAPAPAPLPAPRQPQNPSRPSSRQITNQHRFHGLSRPPTVMDAHRPAQFHDPHEGTYPVPPPFLHQAHSLPQPQPHPHTTMQTEHLAPHHPNASLPPHHHVPRQNPSRPTSRQIAPSIPLQFGQPQLQGPPPPLSMNPIHPRDERGGYQAPPWPQLGNGGTAHQLQFNPRPQMAQVIPLSSTLSYPSREWMLDGFNNPPQLANGLSTERRPQQPPLPPGPTTLYRPQVQPQVHAYPDHGFANTFPPTQGHGYGQERATFTRESGPAPQQYTPFQRPSPVQAQIVSQSQWHAQNNAAQSRPGQPLSVASIETHVMYQPVPSRPELPPAYLTTTSLQAADDVDRMTEGTMTQGTAEPWEGSQTSTIVSASH